MVPLPQCIVNKHLFKMAGRATPEKLMIYKLTLQLHKTYNNYVPSTEWILLNENTILTSRQTHLKTSKTDRLRQEVHPGIIVTPKPSQTFRL